MTKKVLKSCVLVASMLLITRAGAVRLRAASDESLNTQVADLYQLQAAFHQAASGAGVSADTKAQHLAQMLALFTDDAVLVVGATTYVGKGVPGTVTCDPGSLTVCDFFTHHAGSFVLGRNWVSLAPSFKTYFDIQGNTAEVYFECHYFDVATGVKEADVSFGLLGQPATAQATKVDGTWLLSYGVAGVAPLSAW
jgi:hypothetical protein